jgi:hypothetical protein
MLVVAEDMPPGLIASDQAGMERSTNAKTKALTPQLICRHRLLSSSISA